MPSRPRSSLAVLAAAALFALPRAAHAQLDTLRVTWGLHGAYPEYVAASVGASTIHTYANGDQRGFFMMVEPGLNGGRVSIGQTRGLANGTCQRTWACCTRGERHPARLRA